MLIGHKNMPNIEISALPGSKLHILCTKSPKHSKAPIQYLYSACLLSPFLFLLTKHKILTFFHDGTYHKLVWTTVNWTTERWGRVVNISNITSRIPDRKYLLPILWCESADGGISLVLTVKRILTGWEYLPLRYSQYTPALPSCLALLAASSKMVSLLPSEFVSQQLLTKFAFHNTLKLALMCIFVLRILFLKLVFPSHFKIYFLYKILPSSYKI